MPDVWIAVRAEVDTRQADGQFILTGSATPSDDVTRHTGAMRIARVRMAPMSPRPGRACGHPPCSRARRRHLHDWTPSRASGWSSTNEPGAGTSDQAPARGRRPSGTPPTRRSQSQRSARPAALTDEPETFGQLFESLAFRDLSIYAQVHGWESHAYQDAAREIDVVLVRDGAWAGFEVKLTGGNPPCLTPPRQGYDALPGEYAPPPPRSPSSRRPDRPTGDPTASTPSR